MSISVEPPVLDSVIPWIGDDSIAMRAGPGGAALRADTRIGIKCRGVAARARLQSGDRGAPNVRRPSGDRGAPNVRRAVPLAVRPP